MLMQVRVRLPPSFCRTRDVGETGRIGRPADSGGWQMKGCPVGGSIADGLMEFGSGAVGQWLVGKRRSPLS